MDLLQTGAVAFNETIAFGTFPLIVSAFPIYDQRKLILSIVY